MFTSQRLPLIHAVFPIPADVLKCDTRHGANLLGMSCTLAWASMPLVTAPANHYTWALDMPERVEEPRVKMPATYSNGGIGQPNYFITVNVATSFTQEIYRTSAIPIQIAEMARQVVQRCVYKGGGLGGLVTYRLGQTVNELVAFQFAPPVKVVPFLTITVHGPNAAINPGDSDNIVSLAVRYSLRMKLGGRFDMGGLDRKMRQLGDAARHMSRYPAWKWTDKHIRPFTTIIGRPGR